MVGSLEIGGPVFCARARRRRSPGAKPHPGQDARPVVRQRQDGAGHAGRARSRVDAAAAGPEGRRQHDSDDGRHLALQLPLLLAHPGVRHRHRLPVALLRVQPSPDVEPVHHRRGALRDLRGRLRALPARGRRGRLRAAVGQPALADVVPRRDVLLAADDADLQAAAGQGGHRRGDQPARGPLRQRHPRQRPDLRAAAVLRAGPEDARGALEPAAHPPGPVVRLRRARGPPGRRALLQRLDRDRVALLPLPVRRARPRQPARHRDPDVAAAHRPGRVLRVLRGGPPREDVVLGPGRRDAGRLPVPRLLRARRGVRGLHGLGGRPLAALAGAGLAGRAGGRGVPGLEAGLLAPQRLRRPDRVVQPASGSSKACRSGPSSG